MVCLLHQSKRFVLTRLSTKPNKTNKKLEPNTQHTAYISTNIVIERERERWKLDQNCITIYGNLIWLLLITIFTSDWFMLISLIFPAIVLHNSILYPNNNNNGNCITTILCYDLLNMYTCFNHTRCNLSRLTCPHTHHTIENPDKSNDGWRGDEDGDLILKPIPITIDAQFVCV